MRKLFGKGALVDAISPDGIAARYDIQPGDVILAIDGDEPTDLIDYQLLTAYDAFTLTVRRGDEQFDIEIDNEEYQPLGIRFPSAAFDGVHVCDNHCTFCFLKQGIPGLRQTMYIKDDDYRLSFLYGNFITLTNLKDEDFARIGDERLSPLHVSVHATNPVVRERLVRSTNGRGGKIMEDLRRLAAMDIEFNTQLVLVPEVNDGAELDRSIADLLTLMPHMQSIAAVPVGLTRRGLHREEWYREQHRILDEPALRMFTTDEMRQILAQIRGWQTRLRAEHGRSIVHAADEFYLNTGTPLPPAARYDGFPQLEDGIGLTRLLIDEWARAKKRKTLPRNLHGRRATIGCATLIAPTMRSLVADVNAETGAEIEVRAIENRLFGPDITVSGLLSGKCLLEEFGGERTDAPLFLPRSMFDERGLVTVDDMTLPALSQQLGRTIAPASQLLEVIQTLARLPAHAPAPTFIPVTAIEEAPHVAHG
jgi:putative radical SAM enzyme (TIGR03279 family)